MSQREFLRRLDADLITAFADCGMADPAIYTPAGGAPSACTVLVDRNAQFFGELGEVAGSRVLVTLFLADVAAPGRGGVVVVDGDTYKLDQEIERDESKAVWVVIHA